MANGKGVTATECHFLVILMGNVEIINSITLSIFGNSIYMFGSDTSMVHINGESQTIEEK